MASPKFYSKAYLYLILVLVVSIFGFIPSYFSEFEKTDGWHHFHGISAMLWLLLVIAQPALYSFNKIKIHKKLGWISVILVPTITFGGLYMMRVMMLTKGKYAIDNIEYYIAVFDFSMLLPFIAFYILAIINRKKIQLHARYMICTAIFPLLAPVSRLLGQYVFSSWTGFMTGALFLEELLFFILILDDKRKGKIHPPYVIALIVTVIFHLSSYIIPQMSWWKSMIDLFAM